QLNPELPPPLVDLIMCLLEKKPSDRPASAREVVGALEGIAGDLGLARHTPASGTSRTFSRPKRATLAAPSRLHMPIVGLAVLVGLLVVAGLLGWQFLLRDPNRPAPRPTFRGVSENEILIGMSGPFDGPSAALGVEME